MMAALPNRRRVVRRTTVGTALLAVAVLAAAGCERVEPSVFGDWTVADEDLTWTIEMREDSTWSMKVGSLEGEGVFSATEEPRSVHMEPTGRMADVMPGGYQATVEGDTLRLCSIAGCTDMVRFQVSSDPQPPAQPPQ
jgi:hypothetical protein